MRVGLSFNILLFVLAPISYVNAIENGERFADELREYPLLASNAGMCSGIRIGRYVFTAQHCVTPKEQIVRAYFGNTYVDMRLLAKTPEYSERDSIMRVAGDLAVFKIPMSQFKRHSEFKTTSNSVSCKFVAEGEPLRILGYGPADGIGPVLKLGSFLVSRPDLDADDPNASIEVLSGGLDRFTQSTSPIAFAALTLRTNPYFSISGIRAGDSGGGVLSCTPNGSCMLVGVVSHGKDDSVSGKSLTGTMTGFSSDYSKKLLCALRATSELKEKIDSNCCL